MKLSVSFPQRKAQITPRRKSDVSRLISRDAARVSVKIVAKNKSYVLIYRVISEDGFIGVPVTLLDRHYSPNDLPADFTEERRRDLENVFRNLPGKMAQLRKTRHLMNLIFVPFAPKP